MVDSAARAGPLEDKMHADDDDTCAVYKGNANNLHVVKRAHNGLRTP